MKVKPNKLILVIDWHTVGDVEDIDQGKELVKLTSTGNWHLNEHIRQALVLKKQQDNPPFTMLRLPNSLSDWGTWPCSIPLSRAKSSESSRGSVLGEGS